MNPEDIIAHIDLAGRLMGLADRAIQRGKERAEWTAEQEADFEARRAEVTAQPHWQKLS